MKKLLRYTLASTVLFLTASNAWSQFLDPTFGTGGKAGPFLNGFLPASQADNISSVQSIVVDNGKIWIAGRKHNGTNYDLALMRLNADGTPDASFGTGGVQTFGDISGNEYATCIVYHSSINSMVLGGFTTRLVNNELVSDIVVLFLNPDGTINNQLGQGGLTIIDAAVYEEIYSIAFGNNSVNGIYLGGYTTPVNTDDNQARGRIYRLNNKGDFQESIVVDYAGTRCHVYSLAVDAFGLLAGGDNYAGGQFAIARYDQSGSLDNSFDEDGKVLVNVGNSPSGVTQMKVQPDGKIVAVSGFFDVNAGFNGAAVARLNSNGSLDESFNGGYAIVPFDYDGRFGAPRSIALQADGKILVSGTVGGSTPPDLDFGIARLNADGSIDNAFGTNGFYHFDFGNGSIDVSNSLQLENGKLLVGTMSKPDNSVQFSAGIIQLQFTEPCLDADNDGYTTCDGDCHDNNGTVHPGATEVCNNLDDDCDGNIDEGLAFTTYYTDADGDSYGDKNDAGINSCSPVTGKVSNNLDCNDDNSAIHPAATEVCNGVDDNCDGVVDEGCAVTPTVTINSITVNEASGIANLTLSLFPAATVPVKVNYKTIDGTAQSKMKNKDFKAVGNGSITIPAGETSAQISISIIADNIGEPDEQFSVQLTKATGADLGTPSTGVVTITENLVNPVTTRLRSPEEAVQSVNELRIQVFSNPTRNSFRLQVMGNENEKIQLQVIDVNGRVIETRSNIMSGSVLQLGDMYSHGIYFVKVVQGRQRKELKLVKWPINN